MIAAITTLLLATGAAAPDAQMPPVPPAQSATPQAPLAPVTSSSGEPSPSAAIRAVLVLEDRVVAGDALAIEERHAALAELGKSLVAWPGETWRKPADWRALIVYSLIGGSSDVLRTILERGGLRHVDRNLTRGALAFADGEPVEARRFLLAVDPAKYPRTLAVSVLMAQATLMGSSDLDGVLAKLARVRLLAPGTLFEESSLRRQALLLLDHGELSRSLATFARYLRRFEKSLFAKAFRERMLQGLAGRRGVAAEQKASAVRSQLAGIAAEEQASLLLDLAGFALEQGDVQLGSAAASAALPLTVDGSPLHSRAKVLAAALSVTDPGAVDPRARLREVPEAHLQPGDIAVRDAAVALADSIYRTNTVKAPERAGATPPASWRADAPAGNDTANAAGASTERDLDALRARVSAALRQSDDVIKKAKK